jgi:hypothetical protein
VTAQEDAEALAEVLMEHSAVSFYGVASDGAGWYCTCGARVAGHVEWDATRLSVHQAEVVLASPFAEGVRAAERERLGHDGLTFWRGAGPHE